MFDFESKVESIKALFDQDARKQLPDDEFDGELWLLLSKRIRAPKDLDKYPPEVGIYYASRYLQWEVGNGGFIQAASNIPEWFPAAEAGYLALGKANSSALIRRAAALLSTDDEELAAREPEFEELDAEIPEDEWEIDAERVRYARQHSLAFQAVR